MHTLDLRISLQPLLSQLSPHPTLLHASKRHAEIRIITAIHPHHARLHPTRNPMRPLHIPGEHRRAETVARVIRHLDRLVLGGESGDRDDGAEDLFAVDLHAGGDVGEDCGGDEEAFSFFVVGMASGGDGGALGFPGFDIREDLVVLRLCDLRALGCGGREGVAEDRGGGDGGFEVVDEGGVDGVLDEEAAGGGADLALVRHDAGVGMSATLLVPFSRCWDSVWLLTQYVPIWPLVLDPHRQRRVRGFFHRFQE